MSARVRLDGVGAASNKERIMAGYGGVDFIDFDSQLNDEEKLVRQTARQFVENEIIPIIEKHSREGTFPRHLVPQLGELGFFGASLHGYGCAGMSNVAYGLVTQELERGDSGLRSFVSVQSALVMYPIYTYGSDAQKDKWLPLLQQGKAIGCFGLTEPQFGSNPGGMLTRAVKKGSKYVLNCEIPAENLLPNVVGLKGPLGCLNQARYGIGWGALGAAMACYDTALQYAKTRKQFANKPIASHQLVQEKLAWMITEIVKGQLLALHVGRLKDKNKVDPSHISMLQMNNVESVSTYEGTNDIHKLVIGERITGISAFV